MKMILPLLLPLVLFFGGCKKKEFVDGGKSKEEITTPEPKSEEAKVNAPTDSLADNIVGKVISLESEAYVGQIQQLQFNGDGRMIGGVNGSIEDIGFTYKIEGNEVLVFKEEERDGEISFSSSSPKVGDQVEWGPKEEKMRGKITKIKEAVELELESQLVGKWVAKVTGAKALFTFPAIEGQEEWSWYNKETFPDALEYRWEVKFVDPEFGYSFGPSLFKFSDAEGPVKGSLSELIGVCQHDLWKLSEDGGENIGSYGQTKVTENKVHLMVTNKTLIDYLLESKPVHVEMLITTPTFNLNEKVAVDYGSPTASKEKQQEVKEEVKPEEPVAEVKPQLDGVNLDKLEEREGIVYLKGSDTPYTGKATSLYENGQKTEANLKDGKRDGLIVLWHENGQKALEQKYKDGEEISAKYWNRKGEPVDSFEEAEAE